MRSASRIFISTFGALTGLIGFEHALGEILQGPIPLTAPYFSSWPGARFFLVLNGEPAFSIFPTMLAAGVAAGIVSAAYLIWSIFRVGNRYSFFVLTVLSVLMFLSGGGIFPPIFGIIVAIFSNRLHRPTAAMAGKSRSMLAAIWPGAFALALASWLAMIPGVPLLDVVFDIRNDFILLGILVCMFTFFFLANQASKSNDAVQNTE